MKNHGTALVTGLAGILVATVVSLGLWMFSDRASDQEAGAPVGLSVSDLLVDPVDEARNAIPMEYGQRIPMTVYMKPYCICCGEWVDRMLEYGFDVDVEMQSNMLEVRERFGIPDDLAGCHTAMVNGYVVEGHVPGDVVRRFLAEAPAVRGLTVPGMPMGSVGMELGGEVDPYDVLAFTSDGRVAVYSEHGRD